MSCLVYETNQEIHLEPQILWSCNLTKDPSYSWQLLSLLNESNDVVVGSFSTPTLLLPRIIQFDNSPNLGHYPTDVKCNSNRFSFHGSNHLHLLVKSPGGDKTTPTPSVTEGEERIHGDPLQGRSHGDPIRNLIHFYGLDLVLKTRKDGLNVQKETGSQKWPSVHVSDQLKVGNYSAATTVQQTYMMHSTKESARFEVIDPPIRVRFLGGTARYVAEGSPIILTIEVKAPVFSSFDVLWECEALSGESTECFSVEVALPSLELNENALIKRHRDYGNDKNGDFDKNQSEWLFRDFAIEHYEKILDYLQDWQENRSFSVKDLLQMVTVNPTPANEDNETIVTAGEDEEGSQKGYANDDTTPSKGSFLNSTNYLSNITLALNRNNSNVYEQQSVPKNDDPTMDSDAEFFNKLFFALSLTSIGDCRNKWSTIVKTLKIPSEILQPNATNFVFKVRVQNQRGASADQQLVSLEEGNADSIGILQNIPNQRPLGSTRRAIFESECLSCSSEDLEALEYKWTLKKAITGPGTGPVNDQKEEGHRWKESEALAEWRKREDFLFEGNFEEEFPDEGFEYEGNCFVSSPKDSIIAERDLSPRPTTPISDEGVDSADRSLERWKLEEEVERKLLSRGRTNLRFASLNPNEKRGQIPPTESASPHSFLSVPHAASLSSCFRRRFANSNLEPGGEAGATLAGPQSSECVMLALVTRELFFGREIAGIFSPKGHDEGDEGGSLRAFDWEAALASLIIPRLNGEEGNWLLTLESLLADLVNPSMTSDSYGSSSAKQLPPPAGDDVKTEIEMVPPHLRTPYLLLKEISRNPYVNFPPRTVPDKLPLSAKSIKGQRGVMPSNQKEPKLPDTWPFLEEFSFNSHKYSGQVFHKENLEQNSTGKFSKFQTIGKSSDFAQSFNLSSTPKDFEEQRLKSTYEKESSVKFTPVPGFSQMTSTGTSQPVLVIYTDNLQSDSHYLLALHTHNPVNGKRGQAIQYLNFTSAPVMAGCYCYKKRGNALFHGGCNIVRGMYYPTRLLFSYHFTPGGPRTVFYFGSLPWIEFTLPSGLPSTNYALYVSIEAVDSKDVSSPRKLQPVTVKPRYKTNTGILELFLEISTVYKEHPALELQRIRTLARELNILPPTLLSEIFGTILSLVFYQDRCGEGIKRSNSYSTNSFGDFWTMGDSQRVQDILYNSNLFVKSNLLKSCARDQLVTKASSIPTRDEMEVMMMVTTLTLLIGAPEDISWFTFITVANVMLATKGHLMWYWDLQSKTRSEVAQSYFLLTSEMLDKEYDIFDCPSVPNSLIEAIVSALLDVMTKEITSRFLEEDPLTYISSTMKLSGYQTKSKHIVSNSLRLPDFTIDEIGLHGIYTVIALNHFRSPYANASVEINTHVLNLRISWKDIKPTRKIQVNLTRSAEVNKNNYDFRKKGTLNFQTFPVYNFEVTEANLENTLMITLEIYKLYTPLSAVMMICKDMQSLEDPLKTSYLNPYEERMSLKVSPGELSKGSYILVVMDTNSLENQNWPDLKPDKQYGIDFWLGAWWAECYVWSELTWNRGLCQVLESSSWDSLNCLCSSTSTIYGALTTPLLTKESTMAVNELMLLASFVALYFIIFLLIIYFFIVLLLFKRERTPTRRQHLWLRDNDASHPYAYLLTINTGAQRRAGTASKVFAILHGTDAMSDTRELQSNSEDQLFTRGSVCSFIWTSHVPLGDILSVELWHDNCDSKSGWFVCEVSVADLNTGATFVYPCYKWLSVASEDGQVMREISFEKPTTFFQDLANWLPQYVSEHTLWYTLYSSGRSEKFFRLQSLTILVTVCLLLGTIALNVVQFINSSHTMMTPDPHIETLYFGLIIAVFLLPVQWILRLVFQVTNKLEERAFYNRIVKDMIKRKLPKLDLDERGNDDEAREGKIVDNDDTSASAEASDEDEETLNPDAEIWKDLKEFAHTLYPDDEGEGGGETASLHPLVATLRRRRKWVENATNLSESSSMRFTPTLGKIPDARYVESHIVETPMTKKVTDKDLSFYIDMNDEEPPSPPQSPGATVLENEQSGTNELNSEAFQNDSETLIKSTTIYSGIGWLISLGCVVACSVWLFKSGSGMPKDYSSLWVQTVLTAFCASNFIVQPLALTVFALYKVCVYRITGYRGFALFCKPVPLELAITVWNHFKDKSNSKRKKTQNALLLQNLKRKREMRLAHPPTEDQLLKHRRRILLKDKISDLIRYSIYYLAILFLLIIVIHNIHREERFRLNDALRHSATNGSCIDKNDYLYTAFQDIQTDHDWWKWSQTELLDLIYNRDDGYSTSFYLFCDTNSLILGTPRIRRYYSNSTECLSDEVSATVDESLSDVLGISSCYPKYKNDADILRGFLSSESPTYDWDAHYLSIVHGRFSGYGKTPEETVLPENSILASMVLLGMQGDHWSKAKNRKLRAILTEFTLFHPQTRLYSSVDFLAEFPASSGANTSVLISSTLIDKYETHWAYVSKIAELVLVAVSMALLKRTATNLCKIRGKFWLSFWTILDLLTTILCWCYVVCLMLRVRIAEDLLWALKGGYYEDFVNIRCLTTWDGVLGIVSGFLLAIHIMRSLWFLNFIPAIRKHAQVLYTGTKEALKISFGILFFLFICSHLGYMLFQREIYQFSTIVSSVANVFQSVVYRTTFYNQFSLYYGWSSIMANLFFLITFILGFFMIFGMYKAVFIHTKKNHVYRSRLVEVTWQDILDYFSEKRKNWFSVFKKKNTDEIHESVPLSNLYLSELEAMLDELNEKLDSILDLPASNSNARLDMNVNSSFDDDSSESSSSLQLEVDDVIENDIQQMSIENENVGINMRAFDGITSAPSELDSDTVNLLEEITRRQRLLIEEPPSDDHEQMSKFLHDVTSASSEGLLAVSSHGKYGKSILKLNRRSLLPFLNEDPEPTYYEGNVHDSKKSTRQTVDNKEIPKFFSPKKIHFEGIEDLLKEYGIDEDSDNDET